jgi:hypothetical protein
MNWRLASRLSVIVLAVLVIIIVLIFQHHSNKSSPPPPPSPTGGSGFNSGGLDGTSMGGTPAPAFQLTDQNGQTISLAQFRGQPVVLTFMYTHCPDECPANAGKLHAAHSISPYLSSSPHMRYAYLRQIIANTKQEQESPWRKHLPNFTHSIQKRFFWNMRASRWPRVMTV